MKDKIAEALLKPISPSVIVILGVYTILWGLWLINPFTSVFASSAVYSAMSFLPEAVWGGIAVVSGVFIIGDHHSMEIGAFISFLHWTIVGFLLLIGSTTSPFGITALTFAIYSGLVWLNSKCSNSV